jgi:hypothetical protein
MLAAKSRHREQKPEAQARKVVMKRLGLEEVPTELPDEASFEEFQTAFILPCRRRCGKPCRFSSGVKNSEHS